MRSLVEHFKIKSLQLPKTIQRSKLYYYVSSVQVMPLSYTLEQLRQYFILGADIVGFDFEVPNTTFLGSFQRARSDSTPFGAEGCGACDACASRQSWRSWSRWQDYAAQYRMSSNCTLKIK